MANSKSLDSEFGSNQYLTITDAAQNGLALVTDFTFEGCINIESNTATQQVLMAKWGAAAAANSFYLAINNTGVFRLAFMDASGNLSQWDTDSAFINLTTELATWIHFTAIVDISVPSLVIYKNDATVAVTATSTDATSIIDSASNFNIGTFNSAAPGGYIDGKIDEFRVWNKALSAAEAVLYYDKRIVSSVPYLVANWHFDDDYADASGNGNTLTPIADPVFSTTIPTLTDYSVSSGFFQLL